MPSAIDNQMVKNVFDFDNMYIVVPVIYILNFVAVSTIEPSVCGGKVALCQITLTICYNSCQK